MVDAWPIVGAITLLGHATIRAWLLRGIARDVLNRANPEDIPRIVDGLARLHEVEPPLSPETLSAGPHGRDDGSVPRTDIEHQS